MVNKILPTSVIRDNPDIRYKTYLEYLEGDDLEKTADSIRNETKRFLCKNILYNNDIVNINGNMQSMSYYGHGFNLIFPEVSCSQFDNKLFDKYFNIRSYFLTLKFSYSMLVNFKIFAVCDDADYQIVPLVYKDFYEDIDIDHMLHDYSSFSTIIDYTRGIVYMNDVLMDYMKQNADTQYEVLCNVLVNRKSYELSKSCDHDNVMDKAFWTQNNYAVVNAIENDKKEIEDFALDYLPDKMKLTMFEKPERFVTDDQVYVTYANMPYRVYSKYVSTINGALYHNDEFGYFSQDKNRTAINVLAYDICKNGFIKPLLFKLLNGKLIAQSKTRLLIAQYLKMPYVPAVIYQTSDFIEKTDIRKYNLFEKNGKIDLDQSDVELKQMLYPDLPQYMLVNLKI